MGGDLFYAPPTPANLLLIARGVDNRTHPIGAVQLLYSLKNERELIFKVCTCGALEDSITPCLTHLN